MEVRKNGLAVLIVALFCLYLLAGTAAAGEGQLKIATVSVRDVIAKSTSGQEARKVLEAEVTTLRGKIQKEQDEVDALRDEIEKKSSVWSVEIRQDKERDYQKKLRELQIKSDDAQFALQKLEKKVMEPILKELHQVFAELGKKNGYTLIIEKTRTGLESPNGLLYADDSLDISDQVIKALESRLGKGDKKE